MKAVRNSPDNETEVLRPATSEQPQKEVTVSLSSLQFTVQERPPSLPSLKSKYRTTLNCSVSPASFHARRNKLMNISRRPWASTDLPLWHPLLNLDFSCLSSRSPTYQKSIEYLPKKTKAVCQKLGAPWFIIPEITTNTLRTWIICTLTAVYGCRNPHTYSDTRWRQAEHAVYISTERIQRNPTVWGVWHPSKSSKA